MGRFLDSTLGRKVVMAGTGLLLLGFLVMHLLGNLTLYADSDGTAFIAYADGLHKLGPLLWMAEVGLVLLFGLHIYMAIRLTRQNNAARPIGYAVSNNRGECTPASRSMLITGLVVLGFLIVHLFNLRFAEGVAAPHADDLYGYVREVLANPMYAGIYFVGAIAIGVHLSHGFRSLFQSLGAFHPRLNKIAKIAGIGLAVLLAIGFASFPVVGLLIWKGEIS